MSRVWVLTRSNNNRKCNNCTTTLITNLNKVMNSRWIDQEYWELEWREVSITSSKTKSMSLHSTPLKERECPICSQWSTLFSNLISTMQKHLITSLQMISNLTWTIAKTFRLIIYWIISINMCQWNRGKRKLQTMFSRLGMKAIRSAAVRTSIVTNKSTKASFINLKLEWLKTLS